MIKTNGQVIASEAQQSTAPSIMGLLRHFVPRNGYKCQKKLLEITVSSSF